MMRSNRHSMWWTSVLLMAPLLVGCDPEPPVDEETEVRAEGVPPPPNVEAPPPQAERTESGLAFLVLEPGDGETYPDPDDQVLVHYTGWTTDGRMFDTSLLSGTPQIFRVDDVIPGWTEGLQLMSAGEERRYWIPSDLAYGEMPAPNAPEGMLVFDIHLLQVLPDGAGG